MLRMHGFFILENAILLNSVPIAVLQAERQGVFNLALYTLAESIRALDGCAQQLFSKFPAHHQDCQCFKN